MFTIQEKVKIAQLLVSAGFTATSTGIFVRMTPEGPEVIVYDYESKKYVYDCTGFSERAVNSEEVMELIKALVFNK